VSFDGYDLDGLNLGLLVLRLLLGLTLAAHGLAKVKGGLIGVGRWFQSEGLRPGILHAGMAASVETVGGLALAAGLFTPLAALAIVANMTTAGFVGHRHNGFFIIREGWEYTMVIGVGAATVAATGPGQWSVDNALDLHPSGVGWFLFALVGGVIVAAGFLAVFFRPAREQVQTG